VCRCAARKGSQRAALAVLLLGVAAFATGSPLQMMVTEKAATASSLASSAD
jgi:DHA1 family inner membrane transport protein